MPDIVCKKCISETMYTGGKINLFLFITGKRPDGYHELSTMFFPLTAPVDTLIFRSSFRKSGIRVFCDDFGIDVQHNTLTKAYRLYTSEVENCPSVDVELIKGIPQGAGLGGGSADAAVLLQWLQKQVAEPLSSGRLMELAACIGADVPFFLLRKPCIAQGIGEKLTPVDVGITGHYCVLVCPRCSISTAWAYSAWDTESTSFSLTVCPKADKNNRSSYQFFFGMNDFELVAFAQYPELPVIKRQLLQQGAYAAGMSGSGSTMFGLFENHNIARQAVKCLVENSDSVVFGPLEL